MTEFGIRRMTAASERVSDSAVPIYRQAKRGTPELIGSGVLLEICTSKFLCTAAHVLDAREGSNLYLPHESTIQTFGAPFRITQIPASGRRRDDKFDFAVAQLVGENTDRFSKYRFITLSQIDQNEVPRAGRTYSFVGYPASRNKSKRGTDEVRGHIVQYNGTPLGQERYDKEGFNVSAHLIIEFGRKAMLDESAKIVRPIDPHGVSGGAVWRLGDPREFERGANVEELVGVAMEFRNDALIALRISVILEAIRSDFPWLAQSIPRSHWFGAQANSAHVER